MPKRFKQLVALLMITMLLLMYVPIQAQDTTEGSSGHHIRLAQCDRGGGDH